MRHRREPVSAVWGEWSEFLESPDRRSYAPGEEEPKVVLSGLAKKRPKRKTAEDIRFETELLNHPLRVSDEVSLHDHTGYLKAMHQRRTEARKAFDRKQLVQYEPPDYGDENAEVLTGAPVPRSNKPGDLR